MNTKELEDSFKDMGGKLCELIGWRKSVGQLYVHLYLSNQPLSLDEIAWQINMSKSSVWAILQKLQRLRAVNKVWFKNKRKDHFVAERNIDVVFRDGVIPELVNKLGFARSYMDQALRVSDRSIEMETDQEKQDLGANFIAEMNRILEKAQVLLKIISQTQGR